MAHSQNPFPDECISTATQKDKDGYGVVTIKGKKQSAHRVAYRLFVGPVQHDQVVRHKCDNPSCINPNHLELGNHIDNVRDRQVRKRQAQKERHGRAKLTSEQVLHIREYELDTPNSQLAKKYGVSNSLIWQIKAHRIWKGVHPEGVHHG